MGSVRSGSTLTRAFRIINNGGIDVHLSDIQSSEDEGLQWAFLDVHSEDQTLPAFGKENRDAIMIDWDEVSQLFRHPTANTYSYPRWPITKNRPD